MMLTYVQFHFQVSKHLIWALSISQGTKINGYLRWGIFFSKETILQSLKRKMQHKRRIREASLRVVRSYIGCWEKTSARANFPTPPVFVGSISYCNDISSAELQLAWLLGCEVVQSLHQALKQVILYARSKFTLSVSEVKITKII